MEQNVEVKAWGLKCDNPKCDWIDNTVTVEAYPQWINKPCPKCGENVLTEEDYRNSEMLLAVAHIMNSMTKEQLKALGSGIDKEKIEEMKKTPFFKDAKGLDSLNDEEGKCLMTFDTHKEIKVTEITKVN